MNKIIFLSLLTFLTFAHAQLDTMQDRPELDWQKIENKNFQVIFPSSNKAEANYIMNLLNYYRDPVNESYDAELRSWPLVLRTERARPNGFVALMPRRSEWFSHAAITPLISSLEWNQSLAIHEYRHMVQYDFLKRDNLQYGYYLFGEFGQAALMAVTAPQWYFEGDAVWAETVLSDAGRGRNPRFSARLKAMALNNQIPTYDEFLGRVYTTKIPNHYVFGYFLITRAYNVYGKDVWKEIISKAARTPLNPYTFYNAFKYVTGKEFEDFFEETSSELKNRWKGEISKENEVYTQYEQPIKTQSGLYYLKKDLDSFWAIYKDEKKISTLNVEPRFSKIDIKNDRLVYTQFLPHYRYGYKDYADLFVMDLVTKSQKQITKGRRLFHPSLHPHKNQILAVEFADNFKVSIFDFEGNKLQELNPIDFTVTEAIWHGDHAIAIAFDKEGMKHIGELDLITGRFSPMQKALRNNVYNLRLSKNRVYFEADDDGIVNAFSMDTETGELYRCTNETIAAFAPFAQNDSLYYVQEIGNGQRVNATGLNCSPAGDLHTNYLGNSPSSDYHNAEMIKVENFEKLHDSKHESTQYNELHGAFKPHSWNLIGGRGLQLGVTTQNYLNTISANAAIGEGVNKNGLFANLSLNYKKYYPILSLNMDYQERANDIDQWSESFVGAGITLPYTYRHGLFNSFSAFTVNAGNLEVSERKTARSYELDDEGLLLSSMSFSTSFLKDRRFRELLPSLGANFQAQYVDASASESDSFSSYLGFAKLSVFTPGVRVNHGFKIDLSSEYRQADPFSYRIVSPAESVNNYAFSRGYEFEYVSDWQKASLNYMMPIAYPNYAFDRWVYVNRVYTNLYFDHTKTSNPQSLNSLGAELFFETLSLRKIPLTYGLRYINTLEDNQNLFEFFFNLDLVY
ncbi:MAG: hypothetical protein CME64_03665 [Halobacteriovoraceae bacterium]|nr:hypothetical protein [Halobacteriovoraceae bacterium]